MKGYKVYLAVAVLLLLAVPSFGQVTATANTPITVTRSESITLTVTTPLPTLTIHDGHTTRQLPACRDHNAPIPSPVRNPAPTPGTSPAPTPPQLKFYRPAAGFTVNAALPNTDTAYALAYFTHAAASSQVVVIRAKAPTSPPGSHPSPWPDPHMDMRYWSMCIGAVTAGNAHLPTVANKLPSGQTDYGCRADDATARNTAGDYTYVIGTVN